MNPQDQKIQELERKNEELNKKLEDFSSQLQETKRSIESHTHLGNDGSSRLYHGDIVLKPGRKFQSGSMALEEFSGNNAFQGSLVVGKDADSSGAQGKFKSAQVALVHLPDTDGTTNYSYLLGIRTPSYVGTDGNIVSGGTTFTQNTFTFEVNELVGAYLQVYNPSVAGEWDTYEIASNTASGITITGGTWTFTGNASAWYVYMPVYLGWSEFPWRRVYTTDGISGGIRFGQGDTNGGQNALLYTDGTSLKFRKKDGSIKIITMA